MDSSRSDTEYTTDSDDEPDIYAIARYPDAVHAGIGKQLRGYGRVFLETREEVEIAHPGYRGPLLVDALGAWINDHCEMLLPPTGDEEVSGEWVPVESQILVPWSRIDSIEWGQRWTGDD